jgi:DNA-binding transcriptional ArsR family regulator
MEYFIKDTGKNRIVYKSLLIDTPTSLGILANKTALDLIKELSLKPLCAMDLARRLGLHEQKVYYNLRMLEKSGIIKLLRTEERTGGTAKVYTLTEPVVSVKLAENAFMTTDTNISVKNLDLLKPFIIDGKLNAKIILGDTYSHGQYDAPAVEGPYAFDFAVLLGSYLTNLDFPYYKFDTEVNKEDLEDNLILIGKFKTNIAIQKINPYLPVYFDDKTGLSIISRSTKKVYDDPRIGIILKLDNPFNKNKKILLFGGIGRRGVQSAILAFTKHTDKLSENNGMIVKVVKGYDKSGDKIIDSVKFLE